MSSRVCGREVRLVYRFCLQIYGDPGLSSDYDFGILFDRVHLAPRACAPIAHELSRVLDTERLDVVPLNRAPVELAYAIVVCGDLIYQSDMAERVDYEAYVMGLYGVYLPILRAQRRDILKGGRMPPEFSGIERRSDELNERLSRLTPLREKARADFDEDPYLRDIF